MQATEEINAASTEAQPAGAPDAAADQASPGESGASNAAERSAVMNGWFRGLSDPTSKPEESDATGESAPTDNQGDVKPAAATEMNERLRSNDGRFSRRGVPEAVKDLAQENADLKAQLAERDPEKLREQWLADTQKQQAAHADQAKLDEMAKSQQANVERYRRLIETPDHKLDAADYTWREEFKDKLDAFPEVQQFHRTDADLRIKHAETAHSTALKTALSRHVGLPGVDEPTFRTLSDWGALGDHLYAAGQKARQSEIDTLSAENRKQANELRQLRVSGQRGIGAASEPAPAGRSSAAVPRDKNEIFNGWLRGE